MTTRVLLLEEDATFARELLRGLSEAGLDVTLLRDGDAGLARAIAEKFDALIVSAELPGINGFRLCGKLRRDPAFRSPIVLMGSERTVGFEEHQKLETRANGYLRKPVVIAELITVLERLQQTTTTPPRPPPLPKIRKPEPSASALNVALDRAEVEGAVAAQLRRQLAEREAQLKLLRTDLEAARSRTTPSMRPSVDPSLREQVLKKERELVEQRAALAAERHAVADLKRKVAQLETKITDAESASIERDSARREVGDMSRAAIELRILLTRAQGDLAKVTAEALADKHALEQLRHALGTLQSDLDAAREDAGRTTEENKRFATELEQLRTRADAAEASVVSARSERDKVEASLHDIAQRAEVADTARADALAAAAKVQQLTAAAAQAKRLHVESDARHARQIAELRSGVDEERTKLREQVHQLQTTETELRATLARDRDRHAEDLTRAEERYVRHMADVQAEERARTAALAKAQAAREAAEERAGEAEHALTALEERLAREGSPARSQAAQDALERVRAESTAARTRAEQLEVQLRETEARIVELTRSLTTAHGERDQAVGEAKKSITAARDELASTQRAAQVLEERYTLLREEHSGAGRRIAELEALVATAHESTRDATNTMRAQLQGEVASLERKIAAAMAAREEAEQRNGVLRGERDASLDELGRARTRARSKEEEAAQRIAETQAKERLANARARESEQSLRGQMAALVREALDLRESHTRELEQRDRQRAVLVDQATKARQDVERGNSAAVSAVRQQLTTRIRELEAQVAEMSKALEQARDNMDGIRRSHVEEDVQTAEQFEALEARVAEANARVALLERQLEDERAAGHLALEQIEQDRTLIAQAKTVLAELVDDEDEKTRVT